MKKTQPYHARVCLERNVLVDVAFCVCTAGLAGCCNHIAAFLYALEELVHLGLREESDSPTSCLCTWNRPRSRKFLPCRVEDVRLHRAKFMFGKEKRSRGPKPIYNPIQVNKRLVDPAEIAELKRGLSDAHEHALAKDKSGNVALYGPCTWLTALEADSCSSGSDESSRRRSSSSSASTSDSEDSCNDSEGTTLPEAQSLSRSNVAATLEEYYRLIVVATSV